eukprot:TRINITY_DN882_c2_g1_i1.p1 TRINITY_DN882_c2_g1~~TRINITY_DN882_c2_g1_i1.p1  ORF type:complete len:543 (+),score=74.09 TRINITY_DN882_c2_g1_i1:122-1630(+)
MDVEPAWLNDSPSSKVNFRIVSYNILAQAYAKSTTFPHAGHTVLKQKNRLKAIVRELASLKADILCLQELDEFDTFYRAELLNLGYSYAYVQREGRKRDGSGIFYLKDRFGLFMKSEIHYNDITPAELLRWSSLANGYQDDNASPTVPTNSTNGQLTPQDSAPSSKQTDGNNEQSTLQENAPSTLRMNESENANTEGASDQGSDAMAASPLSEPQPAVNGGEAESEVEGDPGGGPEARLKRDCVGVLAALRPVEEPRRLIIVGSTHFFWNPTYQDVKMAQAQHLLECTARFRARVAATGASAASEVEGEPLEGRPEPAIQGMHGTTGHASSVSGERERGGEEGEGEGEDGGGEGNRERQGQGAPRGLPPLFLCGDFNARPNDPVYQLLSAVRTSTTDSSELSEKTPGQDPSSLPCLKSIFTRCGGREPDFTTHTPTFTDTLDYVWLSSEPTDDYHLAVKRWLVIPGRAHESLAGWLPNSSHGSDHLPVGGDVEVHWRDAEWL